MSLNLDGKKILTLFALISYGDLGFHSILDVGNKEIYGIWILKTFNLTFRRLMSTIVDVPHR